MVKEDDLEDFQILHDDYLEINAIIVQKIKIHDKNWLDVNQVKEGTEVAIIDYLVVNFKVIVEVNLL